MRSVEEIIRQTGVQGLVRLPRDMSPRDYYRGVLKGRSVIVMAYAEVTVKTLSECQAFLRIANELRGAGLSAPEIFWADEQQAIAVLEDLGQTSFGSALRQGGVDRIELYSLACDVLKTLKSLPLTQNLTCYKQSRIHENRRQILDYYAPLKTKKISNNSILNEYLNVLNDIEMGLPPCPQGFLHADFHLENLMWLPEGEGLSRCGIIDFQDALSGPLPYDLVNLLEDARVDVPADLKVAMMDRYCAGMYDEERNAFEIWFRFLATQFHCRVIGLFTKVSIEQGRDLYLEHVPRLQAYITQDLEHPVMEPLKVFFAKEKIDFLPFKAMNGDYIRAAYKEAST